MSGGGRGEKAGRFTYVPGPERYSLKATKAHNVVVVDDQEIYIPEDSWKYKTHSKAVNLKTKEKDGFVLIEGGHLGYYPKGIFVNRKVLLLNPSLVIVVDELYSKDAHTYRSYYHFNEEASVTIHSSEAFTYQSRANTVYGRVFGSANITEVPSMISRHYNSLVSNPAIALEASGGPFTALTTIFSLNKEVEIAKVKVTSNFTARTFGDDELEAFVIGEYTVVISHYEWANPTDTFCAHGKSGYGQVVVFGSEATIGSVLSY